MGPGEIVVLLGGNGCGKSTLLRSIAGLVPLVRGRICIAGQDASHLSISARHNLGVSYLLQGAKVFPNLTVSENFQIAAEYGHSDDEAISLGSIFPELQNKRKVRAGLLSGGQRQMLAIEMILGQRPRIALLDEPSAGLAPSMVPGFLRQLSRYARSNSIAVLLVEQNVEEAKQVADRQLRLESGTIEECKAIPSANLQRG